MSFLDEAGGNGDLTEPGQAGLQDTDMVGELDDGGTRGFFIRFHLEEEEFIDFGIGVLDELIRSQVQHNKRPPNSIEGEFRRTKGIFIPSNQYSIKNKTRFDCVNHTGQFLSLGE